MHIIIILFFLIYPLLQNIIHGKKTTPFSNAIIISSNKERTKIKSCSFGSAHQYPITPDEVSCLVTAIDKNVYLCLSTLD